MARFDNKNTKQRATKMSLTELSGVPTGAHEGAHVTIFKTSSFNELVKVAFEDALDELNLEDDLDEIMRELFKNERALHRSLSNILTDTETYPNPREAVQAALKAYSDSISEILTTEFTTTKQFVEFLCSSDDNELTEEERKKRKEKAQKIFGNSKNKPNAGVASDVTKESNMTEKLEKQVSDLTNKLATANKLAAMSDCQKSHYHGLDDVSKEAFLSMSPVEMQAEMTKAEAADPVVYTATDGTEFRKSSDPQMVAMAKRMDETIKANNQLLEKQQVQEFTKQATEEFGNLKGELSTKVAMLKAIASIDDESTRKEISQMLKSASETSSSIYQKVGTSEQGETESTVSKKAQSDLDTLVSKYAKDNNVSTTAAYVKVLETSEGQELYDLTLSH